MDDLISRQAAIDAVKRLSLGETDAMRLAMRIGDYLERLPPAQPEQRWIPCSERLPEDDREVLAVSDGCVLIANWQGEWIKYIELEDDYTILEPVNINVQYWMPLPEPPEGEEK